MSKLPASTGRTWLKDGFGLFRRHSGVLIMLLVANLFAGLLLASIPGIGQSLPTLLIPMFTIAVFEACRLGDSGQRPTPAVLLTGFREQAFKPLLRLSLVYFAITFVIWLAFRQLIDPEMMQKAAAAAKSTGKLVLDPGSTQALLGSLLVTAVATLALSFAPALVYFKKMTTFKSIFYSVFAIIGSFGPVLMMLLTWLGLFLTLSFIVVLILGASQVALLFLMWANLIFTLVLQCAMYVAYRQLLSNTEGGHDGMTEGK